MNIILIGINAKFIHSNLAIRYLKEFAKGEDISILEFTINNSTDFILSEIFNKKPEVICFSCYIWNIEIIKSLSKNLKKVMPNVKIILGGPEVSYDSEEFLQNNWAVDIIIRGEGEETFSQLYNKMPLEEIKGITFRKEDAIISTPPQPPINMDSLPFVWENLDEIENRIIYYETQRGCPFNCEFCLSSIEKGVRFMSLEKVFTQLDFFIKNNVMQVKFVDRTFNCNKKHAIAIWEYLIANDNGKTNFHMEIEAHLIDEDYITVLKKAREGLFQFEIGIQSTNPETLKAVRRNTDFEILRTKINEIKALKNIHIHLDLIAGLPLEGYLSFKKSFNDVYALNADQLQLGFLKVLKGSGIMRDVDKYGILYRDLPPYEVLATKTLEFSQMLMLKAIEELVETYYNSGKALNAVKYMATLFPSPFDFYEKLAMFWQEKDFHKVNHSKPQLYTNLYEFYKSDLIADLLKFDMLLFDNLNNLQPWVRTNVTEEFKQIKREFFNNADNVLKYLPNLEGYTPTQLSRMCRLEEFDHNPFTLEKKRTLLLFNYYQRDFITNHALVTEVENED